MIDATRQDHSKGHRLTKWFVIGLLVIATTSAAAFSLVDQIGGPVPDAWYSDGTGWYIQTGEVHDSAVTLRNVIEIGRDFANGVDALYLAGLSTSSDTAPDALRLVWAPDSSGWGFVWSLQLESDTGLLPVETKAGQTTSIAELAKVFPAPGHRYETIFSYDPANGSVSIAITDLGDGKFIYKGGVQANATDEALWPGVGLQTKDGAPGANRAAFETLGTIGAFLPVGADWVAASESSSGSLVPSRRFDLDDELVIRLTVPAAAPSGQFRVHFEQADRAEQLGTFEEVKESARVRIAANQLPLGEIQLRVDYVDQGKVLLTESRPVTIGFAQFHVRDLTVDREAGHISGTAYVSSIQQLDEVDVLFEAEVYTKLWDQDRRNYRQELYTAYPVIDGTVTIMSGDGLAVPFALPLPDEPGFYELNFRADTAVKIGTETIGGRQLFTTYLAADPLPGEPYAIAVLPDTQNYARSHPTIYIRQLQWIAEQAAKRNIMLMLHVGDITNDNTPTQWQRSVEAITLLDGVMPYVLSQGNHDMPAHGGGNAEERESTLINRYFPVEKQPWIAGTFEPGRIENSYATFDLQDDKYLVIALEFGPRNEVLDWANEVVAAHPDRKAIMVTHVYTARSSGRSNHALSYPIALNLNTTVNGGDAMWYSFVSRHENMFMTLSGHHDAQNAISRRVARGTHGNAVYEIMTNYQFDVNGGNGFFPLFEFFPDGTIEVQAYSPYLDEYRYDISDYGFDNHFIIDTNTKRILKPVSAVAN